VLARLPFYEQRPFKMESRNFRLPTWPILKHGRDAEQSTINALANQGEWRKEMSLRSRRETDALDEWQYWIFRIVLFIIFLVTAYQLLDSHVHIGRIVSSLLDR